MIHLFREGLDSSITPEARELLRTVGSVCLIQDIATTGRLTATTALTMLEVNPNLQIHALSMLQDGEIDPAFWRNPETDMHTLLKRTIPTIRAEFARVFPGIIPRIVEPNQF